MDVQKCSSCGARILWCKTAKGKSMPVDEAPVEGGNIMLADGVARVVKPEEILPGFPLFVSHFATCTDPTLFRKKKDA